MGQTAPLPLGGDVITNSKTGIHVCKCQIAEWSNTPHPNPRQGNPLGAHPEQTLGSCRDPQLMPPFFPPPTNPHHCT